MKMTRHASASLPILLAACLTEVTPVLFLSFDAQLPPMTTANEIMVSGSVLRSPADLSTVKVVTATGGAETVVDTTDTFGIFEMTIPLVSDATNLLVFVAQDDTGARSSRIQWRVEQQPGS